MHPGSVSSHPPQRSYIIIDGTIGGFTQGRCLIAKVAFNPVSAVLSFVCFLAAEKFLYLMFNLGLWIIRH